MISVNIGTPRDVVRGAKTVTTSIWKEPVAGRTRLGRSGLAGDTQSDPVAHGGVHKASYAYALEDLAWWSTEVGRALGPGVFGENLTLEGVEVSGALVGERWRVGEAVLEVAEPRIPCWKLGLRMGDPGFPRRFGRSGRPGAYLRTIEVGTVAPGDTVEVLFRPDHYVDMTLFARIRTLEPERAHVLLGIDPLSEEWRTWALEAQQRHAEPPA